MLGLTSRYCLRQVSAAKSRLAHKSAAALSSKSTEPAAAVEEIEEDQRPTFLIEDMEPQYVVETNKSRLLPQHRNMLQERLPYDEPQSWIHQTEKYQRKMYGRYGAASGVDVRICFPTKSDKELAAQKERIAYPHTLPELMAKVKEEERMKRESVVKREEEIAMKLSKLEQWKSELNAKIAKKEADAQAAKDRKERIVEEVRRHFGFKVDPRDDRFKEMLEQKEKEHKRKDKEARRKIKEEKMVAKLVQKSANDKTSVSKKNAAAGKDEENAKE